MLLLDVSLVYREAAHYSAISKLDKRLFLVYETGLIHETMLTSLTCSQEMLGAQSNRTVMALL